jgi:hypothetical protein
MNETDKNTLASLRKRADEGEEFNPTLLARFNDLVAQEARSGKRKHHPFTSIVLRLDFVFSCLFSSCIFTCCLICVAFHSLGFKLDNSNFC